jgi:hypothetical protein
MIFKHVRVELYSKYVRLQLEEVRLLNPSSSAGRPTW